MTDHARAIEAGARAFKQRRRDEIEGKVERATFEEMTGIIIEAAIASGALVPASAGQPFDKIKAGLEEALAVAKGEQPAASIYVHGHQYVPASAVAEMRERIDHIEGGLQLLLTAAKAGDPHKEIIWRVEEELREIERIRQLDSGGRAALTEESGASRSGSEG